MSVFERVRLLGFGVLAVTFIAGALAGAAIDRTVSDEAPRREARSDRQESGRERSYVIDRVDMSDTQRATIDSILQLRVERMRAVWQQMEPRLGAITDSARSEIMSVLTPEQQAEYERMLEQRRRDRSDSGGAADSAGHGQGTPDSVGHGPG